MILSGVFFLWSTNHQKHQKVERWGRTRQRLPRSLNKLFSQLFDDGISCSFVIDHQKHQKVERWGEGQKRRRSKPGAKISLNSSLMILLVALSYHPPEASKDVQRHKRSKTEEASKRQGFSHIPRLLAVLWWFGLPVQMYIVPGEAVVSV